MTTLVFVGPTLPATEVAKLLPSATVCPPIAVGDTLRALRRRGKARPRRIAIIDGFFERMAAVWHKELLLALEAGVEVWGAASMGALRAAELAPWGMRGVGAIYRGFATGKLVADDEVAVAHLPAEYGYRTTSVALVDLRDAVTRAPMLGVTTRAQLLALAPQPFYRDRSWERLVADGRAAALPAAELDRFVAWIAKTRPSRKTADARLLLRTLAKTRLARPKKIAVPRTWALAQLSRYLAGDLG